VFLVVLNGSAIVGGNDEEAGSGDGGCGGKRIVMVDCGKTSGGLRLVNDEFDCLVWLKD
jgi:hypothetical protein